MGIAYHNELLEHECIPIDAILIAIESFRIWGHVVTQYG